MASKVQRAVQALSRRIGQVQTAANRAEARGDRAKAAQYAQDAADLRSRRSALLRGKG